MWYFLSGFARYRLGSGLMMLVLMLGLPLYVQAACQQELERAETRYYEGAFDETIQLVSSCLENKEPTREEAVKSYRLMSLAYLKKNDQERAKRAVENLLRTNPDYEPDPVQNLPAYTALVAIVKQERRDRQGAAEQNQSVAWYQRSETWLAVGGSLLAGGLIAVLTGGGDDGGGGPQPLPPPPGTP